VQQRDAVNDRKSHLAHVVAAWALDLDDLGTKVGQVHPHRGRPQQRAFDHANPWQQATGIASTRRHVPLSRRRDFYQKEAAHREAPPRGRSRPSGSASQRLGGKCLLRIERRPVTTDFYRLPTEDQIKRIAALAGKALAQYGVPEDAPLSLLKHRENSVFAFADPTSGARYVIRVHRAGYQTDQSIRSELQWMDALRGSGVKTPEVLKGLDGEVVHTVATEAVPEPRHCDVLRWIDGVVPDESNIAQSFRTLGEIGARCHLQARHWKRPQGFYRQSWDEEGLLGEHPIVGRFWDLEQLTDQQRDLLFTARAVLRERLRQFGKAPDRYGLIHADLMPENIIISAAGVQIIDFDDCGFGWNLYDLGTALFLYLGQEVFDTLLEAWVAGYRAVQELPDAHLAMLPAFLLLRAYYALSWVHSRKETEIAQLLTGTAIEAACHLAQNLCDAH
jgi:Ser/Thr protein kinase RdoA (MazF antagonist)